jgi:hypothetical protein
VAPPESKHEAVGVSQAPIVLQKKKSVTPTEPAARSKSLAEASQSSAGAMADVAKPTAQTPAPEKALDAANAVVSGVVVADAIAAPLVAVKSDTLGNYVKNVYEVSPGVEVTLVETSFVRSSFSPTEAKAERAASAPMPMSMPAPVSAGANAPTPPSIAMRRKLPVNTITWMKGSRTMTLTGPMTVEELTAIRMRLPEDKR